MFPSGTGCLRDICPPPPSHPPPPPPPPLIFFLLRLRFSSSSWCHVCTPKCLTRDQSGRGEQVGQAHLGTRCWAKHGSKVLLAIVFSCQFPCFESKPGGNNLWKIYNARFLEYSTTWQHMNCELLRRYNRGLANAEQVLEMGYGLKLQQKLIEKYKTIQQVMQPLAWCWVNAGNRLPTRSLCLPDTRDTNTLGHQCIFFNSLLKNILRIMNCLDFTISLSLSFQSVCGHCHDQTTTFIDKLHIIIRNAPPIGGVGKNDKYMTRQQQNTVTPG